MEDNNWQIILEVLTEELKDTIHQIKNEDPIVFCLKYRGVSDILQKYINDFVKHRKKACREKNAALSVAKREKGNRQFKMQRFQESLDLYTDSIFYAPKDSTCLPLAYANRSSVLFITQHIKESLQDVDNALNNGYPVSNITKLLLRKGRCLSFLKQFKEAEAVLTDALQDIDSSCQKNKDLYKAKIKEEILHIQELSKIDKKITKSKEIPLVKNGENPDFAFASISIGVVYYEEKGRYVVAKDDIEIGDILFVEKPFAFVVLKKVCNECCLETVAPIPCLSCVDANYCSVECRDLSWKTTHKFECGFYELLRSVGIAHLGLRVILQAAKSFRDLITILKKFVPEQILENGASVQYRNLGYQNVYNLVCHTAKVEAQDLFQYSVTALLLSMHMQQHTQYFANTTTDINLFGSLVLRHIIQLICNGHAVTNLIATSGKDENSVVAETEERIGTAIYPSASMMNHSCDPSIINSFYKNQLIVRAYKRIKKGEEVYNCYGPHYKRMTRIERQGILSGQYFFDCKCRPCVERFDFQDKFRALQCSRCKGPLVLLPAETYQNLEAMRHQKKIHPYLGRPPDGIQEMICMDCDKHESISGEKSEKEFHVNRLLREGEHSLSQNNIKLALNKFVESWRLAREVLYKHHKDLIYAADQVARCLATLKEYDKCLQFLRCCVMSIEEQYGAMSIELANELKKMADVMFVQATNLGTRSKSNYEQRKLAATAIRTYERADNIFRLLYGPHHPKLQEMERNKNLLLLR